MSRMARCFVTFTLAFLAAFYGGAARAASVTMVPADTSVTIGETVVLRVQLISPFSNFEGFKAVYRYEPNVLSFIGATPGEVFTSAPGAIFATLRSEYAAPMDSVWYEAAVLDGTSSGPGILAYLTFQTIGPGNGTIVCKGVDLRDSDNQQTLATCFDAIVHVFPPVPVRPTSWSRLKVLYR